MKSSRFLLLLLPLVILGFFGCSENTTDPGDGVTTDSEALQQLATEDSSTQSFDQNYNDEGALGFGKTQDVIFPVRIGRKITSVSRTFSQEIIQDTGYVTVTTTFNGVFIIAASTDSIVVGDTTAVVDTIIQKPFTSIVVRKLIFVRIGSSQSPRLNWKMIAFSLPAGGTVTNNISITKAVISYQNGDSLVITDPNMFYFSRFGGGGRRDIPVLVRNGEVTLRVEITSNYSEDDFVSLTYGANLRGQFRVKKRLNLISSEPSGSGYVKVYSQTFRGGNAPGHFHAVIDALPRGVVFDSGAQVESKIWGVPYVIR